jgi:hypothetical protein
MHATAFLLVATSRPAPSSRGGAGACACTHVEGRLVASIHTHAQLPNTAPAASCAAHGANGFGANFGDGPSGGDYAPLADTAWQIPGCIIDGKHVHRIDVGESFGDPFDTWRRSTTCPA